MVSTKIQDTKGCRACCVGEREPQGSAFRKGVGLGQGRGLDYVHLRGCQN